MKRILLTAIIISMISAAYSGCSQWKVSSLKEKELLFIENGGNAGNVAIRFDDYALTDLSFGVGVYGKKVFTFDNIMKRVQILDMNGRAELVIGDLKNIDPKKTPTAQFNFSTIGTFAIDKNYIYIQNRFPEQGKTYPNASEADMNFSPSYVLIFDWKGKLQSTLGQQGSTEMPFYYIESLFVDSRERLFVVSRSFDTWNIYRFENRKRDFNINLGTLDFREKDGNDVFEGKIENVKIYQSGEMVLISVAYYQNKRLKYRKVYDYSIPDRKIERDIVSIPDPKNVLFNIIDEKHLYFWNMEKEDLRLMICNMQGHIINNIQIKSNDTKYLYSELINDDSGKLYSYHVTKKGITLYGLE